MSDLQMFPGLHHDPSLPPKHFRVLGTETPVKIVDEKDIDLEESVE